MAYPSNENDPNYQAEKIQRMLTNLIEDVRERVGKVSEPKFQALLETSAEVLAGLRTAYEHYEKRKEPAWA